MVTETPANSSVFIVLATWNGEDYIAEQIESILAQTESAWTLLVRDDGSSDSTVSIVTEFCSQDRRIELLSDECGRLGPQGSFGVLMQAALDRGATYVCLADQDDVWHPDKVAEQLRLIQETEHEHKTVRPTLIYCDLTITDQSLDVLQPSFNQIECPPDDTSLFLAALLTRNYVPGCSVMVNQALLELSLPLPCTGIMHDHWLTLCAASAGTVHCIQRPLLKYRRHTSNVTPTGSNRMSLFSKLRRLFSGEPFSEEALARRWAIVEAVAILQQRLPPECENSRRFLYEFSNIFRTGTTAAGRVLALWRLGVPADCGCARALIYYAQVCCLGHRQKQAGDGMQT